MHDVFFFTDIHGCRPLFEAIMNYCKEQDEEASIIFGGDACDRGTDGYSIMKELLDNPKVLYLKGNHEDLFVKAAKQIREEFNFVDANKEYIQNTLLRSGRKTILVYESLLNGGLSTLVDWIIDGMPMDFVEKIDKLPLTFVYGKCDFSHAAAMPQTFQSVYTAEHEGRQPNEWDIESILWSRATLNYGWTPDRVAVFGHTPVVYLPEYTNVKFLKTQPVYYYVSTVPTLTGAKLDMDTGAAFTNKAFVLNVLTMKAQGFELKNNKVEEIEVIQF